MARFSGKMGSQSPKDGAKNKGVLRTYRENKRIQAEIRQEEFDAAYAATTLQAENRDKISRKEFGVVRHVERVTKPKSSVASL
jgi:hypothetical protein